MILALGSSLAAAGAYGALALAAGRLGHRTVRAMLALAWLAHGLALLAGLTGSVPSFGFAPALSMTAWLVLSVYAVESRLYPQLGTRWVLAGLGAATVLLALAFPGTPHAVNLSPWLPLHWALGIASYGLLGTAAVHAWLMVRAERSIRRVDAGDTGLPLLKLEHLMFRFVQAGFVLLSATLLAGWIFGGQSAGGWRWDHKTVFSVLAWAVLATLLLGRLRYGWRGRRAAIMVYLGTMLLLLAYVGSRFVLEVVLRRA